jgi:hypothetical protein
MGNAALGGLGQVALAGENRWAADAPVDAFGSGAPGQELSVLHLGAVGVTMRRLGPYDRQAIPAHDDVKTTAHRGRAIVAGAQLAMLHPIAEPPPPRDAALERKAAHFLDLVAMLVERAGSLVFLDIRDRPRAAGFP